MEVLLGLFGFIYSASIENLGVEDCNIVGFGVLGGLVGVSLNNSTIANCYVTGSVSGNDKFIGGLVGRNYNSTISNSYAVVNVSGEESTGGLAGYSGRFGGDTTSKSIISNCYVAGSVSGGMGIGGLVGENGWTIVSNSYATCNVSGEEYVGGLLGVNFANSSISNCIATNESVISSVNTSMINRIAGFNEDGSICNNNYALSTMVVQNGSGTVNITNGLNTIAGMEKDVNILQSLLFYTTTGNWYNNTTWDITSSTAVWDICEGKTLPWLRWQKIDCNKIGIAEVVEMINIKIFPNPAQSQFTVTNTENADIQLFNALGQEVFHTYSKEESTVVEVGSLPQGVYMLKVVQKDGSFSVHKVVKR
ncbi:MAG: T9SS type A sorting domain-containing protein [Lentimicrobiaceae bacterium]|nr:T9SS type A sorting domain-containing protein [Lentimicrobiaceae bacterium]